MFERYTEKARRSIFFARYEASQFGSLFIETEHLLLGLLREDAEVASGLIATPAALETIRQQIEERATPAAKVSTSVDLPLSHECIRALESAAEEAERRKDKHIGTEHLFLGLLREETSFAAQLLRQQGLTLHSSREQVRQSEPSFAPGGSAAFARLSEWLAEREARGAVWRTVRKRFANGATHFILYAVDLPKQGEKAGHLAAVGELAQIQKRIESIVVAMELAIANHEFEKARFHSDEERKERENLRLLRERSNLEESPQRVPLLCIEILRDERFSDIRRRCEAHLAEGVGEVLLLDPELKRAYSVTKGEGMREHQGAILHIANPPLELDLSTIFD